jgi:hypothetical protein
MATEVEQIVDDQMCELMCNFETRDHRLFLLSLLEWAVFQLKELHDD